MKHLISHIIIWLTFVSSMLAQVDLKVSVRADARTYVVSLRADTTWTGNDGRTLTGQVTIVAPTGTLEPVSMNSLNGAWIMGTPIVAPDDNPSYDYFFFNLASPTTSINYEEGEEEDLFSFVNNLDCSASIDLISHEGDAMYPDNSLNANVGNLIVTQGGGNGENVYENNYGVGTANCVAVLSSCAGTYHVQVLEDGITYLVSVLPYVTWAPPFNLTSTAQITIRVPTNTLSVTNVQNIIPGVIFQNNSTFNAPEEEPDVDYISFGLESNNTTGITYRQDTLTPLFTFQNALTCSDGIFRLANSRDPFIISNSQNANAANQLTTLGSGPDAPLCDNEFAVKCVSIATATDADGDGVDDIDDQCPNSSPGATVNAQGCTDADGDGFFPDAPTNDSSFDPNDNDECVPQVMVGCAEDSDGDGVLDADDNCPFSAAGANVNAQGCTDDDGDGFFPDAPTDDSSFDPNDNDQCIPQVMAGCDIDSDGDGVSDSVDNCPFTVPGAIVNAQGCTDLDGDGYFPDIGSNDPNFDPRDNNPCIPDGENPACDDDGDGVPNGLDTCPFSQPNANVNSEGCTDDDGDGFYPDINPNFPNYDADDNNECSPGVGGSQCDDDGDGIPNTTECPDPSNCPDTDGDGLPDYQDIDSDNDGITDDIECAPSTIINNSISCADTDGDNTPDYQDSDSDNDGIPDFVESQNSGQIITIINPAADQDNDGLNDAYDPDQNGLVPPRPDTDNDGQPDYRDIDSDDDGISDSIECTNDINCQNSDNDDQPDYRDIDSDGDRIHDALECPTGIACVNSDNDNTPDYLDTDSDDDGILDFYESGCFNLPDNATCSPIDTDQDGDADYIDLDSDDDGLTDAEECASYQGMANVCDNNNNGVPDHLECRDANVTINGPSIVCPSSDVTLNASSDISDAQYVWRNVTTGAVIGTTASIIISNIQTTTTFEASINTAECSDNTSEIYTVEVSPSFDINVTLSYALSPDCLPSDLFFFSGVSNPNNLNLTYNWTGPNGWSSSDPNPVNPEVDAQDNGDYLLVVTSASGCTLSETISINTIDNPPLQPQITGPSEICPGEEIKLSIPQFEGTSINYSWVTPGTHEDIFGLNTNEITIRPTSNNHNGDYQVNISIDGRCTLASLLFNLNVHEELQATATKSGDVCLSIGQNVDLDVEVTGGEPNSSYDYLWTGPSNFVSTAKSPSLIYGDINNGTYTVSVTDDNGCNAVSSIDVNSTLQPTATAKAISNTSVCEGETVTIEAESSIPNSTFNWFLGDPDALPAGAFLGSGAVIETSTLPVGSHEIYLKASSPNNCNSINKAFVAVDVNEVPSINLDANTIDVCNGADLSLKSSINTVDTYDWNGPNGFNSTLENPIIANVTQANDGVYTLQVSSNGCMSNTAQLVVNVSMALATPTITAIGNDCEGETYTFEVTNVDQDLDYTWYRASAANPVGSGSALILSNISTTDSDNYYVTVSDGDCPTASSDNLRLTVQEGLNDNVDAGTDQLICDAETALIGSTHTNASGMWSALNTTANIITPNSPSTSVTELENGENLFLWTVTDNSCNIPHTDTLSIFHEAISSTEDDFVIIDGSRDTSIIVTANDSIFSPMTDLFIIDNPDDLSLSILSDGSVAIKSPINYISEATFTYEICLSNCDEPCQQAEVKILFNTTDCELVPNVITPDGDGDNDTFYVPCLETYEGSSIKIFDRFGKVVFKNTNYTNDWEGTWDNEDLDPGTYFYVIDVNDNQGTTLSGYVYLIK